MLDLSALWSFAMRLKDKRFSIPFCIFEDDLQHSSFVVLCYLFSRSDCSGKAEVSYDDIIRDTKIVSRNTVSKCLKDIKERGWIEYKRRCGSSPSRFFLCVPEKYVQYAPRKNITYLKWKNKSGL